MQTIRRCWQEIGRQRYPQATRLFMTADGGGSNGSRLRLWKRELQHLASELGIDNVVHHLPPGRKWNKIEYRLMSFITMNWKAVPLVGYQVIINMIAATTTTTGLKVHCELDTNPYPKGIKVSDQEMTNLNIKLHVIHSMANGTTRYIRNQPATPPKKSQHLIPDEPLATARRV